MSTTTATTEFKRPAAADDFNGYINGEWESKNSIPDDQNRWGSFMILREDNLERCKTLCESEKDSLVGKLYAKAITQIGGDEKTTSQPAAVVALLKNISDNVKDAESYQRVAGDLLTKGVTLFTHICKSEDSKDPTIRIPHMYQAGLGLPDISYYTDREDLWPEYKKYINDLAALFNLEGVDGEKVFEFEKEIATKHLTRVQRRDPDLVYNKKQYKDEVAPLLKAYFDVLDLPTEKMTDVIVENPALLEFLRDFLPTADPATLRAHALYHTANKFAPMGNDAAINLHFEFQGKKLNGQKAIDPLWKRAVATVERYIGDELGKLYVAQYFPDEKRKTCNAMVNDLKDSLGETLQSLEWMSKETKVQAMAKLDGFGVKIGVPEEWHSIEHLWSGHNLNGDVPLAQAALEWYTWDWKHQEVAKFYSPPEKKLWHMTPQTVNAYYHPEMNEIVFPAGILQPPFFGFENYEQNIGAIGVVIGHEMTHGFDDQGRKYNAKGELKDWWTTDDATAFDARAKPVIDHFGAQLILGKPVSGELTLGENIADIGGLKLALRAAKKHFGGEMSKEQYHRFFEAYALIWRMLIRDEMALKLLAIDPHSPCNLRINCALAHVDEFYTAFEVKEESGMYLPKEKRMNIW